MKHNFKKYLKSIIFNIIKFGKIKFNYFKIKKIKSKICKILNNFFFEYKLYIIKIGEKKGDNSKLCEIGIIKTIKYQKLLK